MAKVIFINAILSGKLDGVIYSRNKAGYYVKGFSNPLNPRSTAQTSARSLFGNAASNWHSMTDLQKIAWASFGENFYKAKDDDNVSPVSGINAYIGTYYSANFYQSVKRSASITYPAAVTASFGSFSASLAAPSNRPAGVIKDSAGSPLPLYLSGGSLVASSGAVTAEFSFPSTQSAAPSFIDPTTSENVGFVLQISVPVLQASHFIASPHRQTVAVIGPPTITAGWSSANKITFACSSADLPLTKFKSWPTAGQIVELAAYLVTTGGQTAQLGTIKLVVS